MNIAAFGLEIFARFKCWNHFKVRRFWNSWKFWIDFNHSSCIIIGSWGLNISHNKFCIPKCSKIKNYATFCDDDWDKGVHSIVVLRYLFIPCRFDAFLVLIRFQLIRCDSIKPRCSTASETFTSILHFKFMHEFITQRYAALVMIRTYVCKTIHSYK